MMSLAYPHAAHLAGKQRTALKLLQSSLYQIPICILQMLFHVEHQLTLALTCAGTLLWPSLLCMRWAT